MLETKRLLIRKFEENDYLDIFEYLSDKDVQIPAGGKVIATIEEAKAAIVRYMKRTDVFAISLKEEKKVIGAIGAYNLTYNDILERHLGFELNKKYWNQGYLTEAAKALIEYLFVELKMDRIAVSNYPFNKASIRVTEKLRFIKEGILRKEDRLSTGELVDRIVYSIIKDEYRSEQDEKSRISNR